MGASDVKAGGAYVEIGAVDKKLAASLNAAAAKLKAFGSAVTSVGAKMAALGAIVTAPLVAAAHASAEAGAAMYDMSRRTGISVEALSTLGFAAKLSGSSLEEMEQPIRRMQKTIAGVADATEGTTGSLDHLGISLDKIKGLSPDEQFRAIAAALNNITDPTEKAAAAMKVFGRTGPELLPMIERLDGLEGAAKRLGMVRSSESARSAKEYEDALTLAGAAVKSIWGALASGLIPILKEKAELLTRVALRVRDWVRANRETVVTVFSVATAVIVAGTALVFLGTAITHIGTAVGAVASIFGIFRGAIGGAVTLITTVFSSGIGLAIAALAGLGLYLLYASDVGQKAMGALGSYFGEMAATAGEAFKGVKDALAAGDWALAAQIAMLGIKAVWLEGTQGLRVVWETFKLWFTSTGNDLWAGAQSLWENISRSFSDAWAHCMAVARYAWNQFTSSIKQTWEGIQSFLTEKWLQLANLVGVVSDAEMEAAKAVNNKQTDKTIAKTLADEMAEEKKIIGDLNAHTKDSTKAHEDALIGIATRNQQANSKAKSDADSAIAAAKGAADDARAKLKAATTQASAKAAATQPLLPPLPPNLPTAKDVEASIGKSIGVAGTFNGLAAGGLGAGTAQERTAKATEETAKNTRGGRNWQPPKFK